VIVASRPWEAHVRAGGVALDFEAVPIPGQFVAFAADAGQKIADALVLFVAGSPSNF
jgi:hypothetical protein